MCSNTQEVRNGDGGFSLACEDLGRMFDNSFPACVFVIFIIIIIIVIIIIISIAEIRSLTVIRLLRPGFSPQWLSELRRWWSNVP